MDGILALGGSAGTTIATAAMRALPFGVPKLMVSTMASGQVKQYVGVRDILMMHSVVDICGLNRISRQVLTNAAQAMIGMVRGSGVRKSEGGEAEDKPLITATMFGVTTPCVEASRKKLEAAGYEVLVFHATGSGGMTMESFIADGLITGVLDVTTTELADELVGGVLSAGRDRLTAAALRGVPQVISAGALDMVNFGPPETVPGEVPRPALLPAQPDRDADAHHPGGERPLGQGNRREGQRGAGADEDCRAVARSVGNRQGRAAVLVARGGRGAISESAELDRGPQVELIELDLHINDPDFAEVMVDTLIAMIHGKK